MAEMSEVEFGEEGREGVGGGDGLEDAEDVLFDGEGTEDRGFLSEITKAELGALVDGKVGDVLVLKVNLPFVGLDEADGDVKGGGFAGAIGAEETDDFTGLDVKGELVEDGLAIVTLDEVGNLEEGHRYCLKSSSM